MLLMYNAILMFSRNESASGSLTSTVQLSDTKVTLKHKPVEVFYTIRGQTFELVESAKYLGVTIDSKLNFNNHIDSVAKKANGTRALLNRNLRSYSQSIKDSTYKTYIRPMVEYASTVWDPHTRRNINKLEQVQRHSARYVTGNHDYTSSISAMVHDLEWPTLEQRRHHCRFVQNLQPLDRH